MKIPLKKNEFGDMEEVRYQKKVYKPTVLRPVWAQGKQTD